MSTLQETLYPLGFASVIFFALRTVCQWAYSEIKGKSVVPKIFWQLSLAGNLSLCIHSLLQLQYHVCVVQAINAIISIRNLDLLKKEGQWLSLKRVVFLFILIISVITLIFSLQNYVFDGPQEWFRTPRNNFFFSQGLLYYFWHSLGASGLILFNCRYWIQWWHSEKLKKSLLDKTFWHLTLAGDLLCFIYFSAIFDLVNAVGPIANLIPITRNLMLIKKEERKT